MRLIAGICIALAAGVCRAGHLGYLYPGGGRAGETVEVLAGGQGNWSGRGVHVEGDGIRCVHYETVAPIPVLSASQREYAKLAIRRMREHKPAPPLPEKRDDWRKCPWLDRLETLDPFQTDILLRSVYVRANPLQMSPSLNQKILFRLEIAPDAKPGVRRLRLSGPGMLSNPVPFFVGSAPEYREPGFTPPYEQPVVPEIVPPAVLNGQIRPGETDLFRIRMRKDETYHFKLFGRFFKPYIGDGVPGFFQPVLELCGEDGRQIAIADRDGLSADPLMICRAPADGVYTLKIRDALYRGREDFVYRVECGSGVYLRPERPAAVLPDLPRLEWLPGMAAESPVLVTGVLAPGERRTIRIPGRKGETKVFQTFARAIGSDIDPVLRLFGPDGKLCAENDDAEPEVLLGRAMHFADAFLSVVLPADGEYRLELSESSGRPGRCVLRVDRPRPDFELVAAPSGFEASMGGIASAELLVRRREGFSGAIALSLEDAGELRLCGNVDVPPGAVKVPVTFRVAASRRFFPAAPFRLVGTAKMPDGRTLVRNAVAADPAMQAFAYTHYVESPTLLWCARWRGPVTLPKKPPLPYRVSGRPGETAHWSFPVNNLPEDMQCGALELVDAPPWLKAGEVRLRDVVQVRSRRSGVLDVAFEFLPDAPPGALHVQLALVPFQYSYKTKNQETRTAKNSITLPALRIEVERLRP